MKLAKTLLACVVALALVGTLAVTAFAAAPTVTVAADKASVAVGDTVKVTVTLTNGAAAESGSLFLGYDASVVDFVEVEAATIDGNTPATVKKGDQPTTPGAVNYAFMFLEGLGKDDATLFYTATFKAVKEGSVEFAIVDGEIDGLEGVEYGKATVAVTAATTAAPTAAPTTEPGTTKTPNVVPKTGDASMAVVAGLVVLAGAAFVASKKSK